MAGSPDQVGEPATRRDVYRHRSRSHWGRKVTTTPTTPPASDDLADQAAGLDALLVDAALGRLRWLIPNASAVTFGAGLARHPRSTGRRLGGLAAEVIRIGAGTSTVGPSKRDRRFVDPAWSENPLLRRVVQAYLATGQTAERLVSDAELGWRDEQRVRFLVENLVEALAPSNVGEPDGREEPTGRTMRPGTVLQRLDVEFALGAALDFVAAERGQYRKVHLDEVGCLARRAGMRVPNREGALDGCGDKPWQVMHP